MRTGQVSMRLETSIKKHLPEKEQGRREGKTRSLLERFKKGVHWFTGFLTFQEGFYLKHVEGRIPGIIQIHTVLCLDPLSDIHAHLLIIGSIVRG